MQWLDRLGIPMGILIAAAAMVYFGVRAIWRWAQPHIDTYIAAAVLEKKAEAKRHEIVGESMKQLTDKVIEVSTKGLELQQSNADHLKTITQAIPNLCKAQPNKQQ